MCHLKLFRNIYRFKLKLTFKFNVLNRNSAFSPISKNLIRERNKDSRNIVCKRGLQNGVIIKSALNARIQKTNFNVRFLDNRCLWLFKTLYLNTSSMVPLSIQKKITSKLRKVERSHYNFKEKSEIDKLCTNNQWRF